MPSRRPPGKRSMLETRLIEVPLPTTLVEEVDVRLFDPVLGKAGYGARAALITRLLKDWVNSTPANPKVEAFIREKSTLSIEELISHTSNQ